MSTTLVGKRVIWVGPVDGANDKPLNVEGVALAADILPGTILKQSDGGLDLSDTTVTFPQLLLVADKDQQRTVAVDVPWTVSENMVAIQPRSGEFMNVLLAPDQVIGRRGTPLVRTTSGLLTIPDQEVVAVEIVFGGDPTYLVTDTLTVIGGTGTAATLDVDTVSAGVITGVLILTGGDYSEFPINPVTETGGSGTNATFNLTPGIREADLAAGTQIVAFADEIIDTSGGAATGTLVRVRIA